MSRILLAGATGMLGGAFADILGAEASPLARDLVSSNDPGALQQAIAASGAKILINCVAYTDLEAAERDDTADRQLNAVFPGTLADACRDVGVLLIHFSSTGCYGNWKQDAYVESDEAQPTTAHHRNKIAGEKAILASGCEALILRTGWLYGGAPAQPKNFVWKRLCEAMANPQMRSDTSQRGCPTFVDDLARATLLLADSSERGLFNVVAEGAASRFDYVSAIVEFSGLPCTVEPGPAFARLAPVSPNETAINARILSRGSNLMPEWRTSLKGYVETLTNSPDWNALVSA